MIWTVAASFVAWQTKYEKEEKQKQTKKRWRHSKENGTKNIYPKTDQREQKQIIKTKPNIIVSNL